MAADMEANKQNMKPPALNGGSINEKRNELLAYFKETWAKYESLFALINDDSAYYLRPERLRHPLIFYFGHTASFYINKLLLGKFITNRINPRLEAICAVGVDEMSWDDLNSSHYDWPSVDEVSSYRDQVAELIEQLIKTMELSLPIKQHSLAWIILMGCEHERIHIETSSVIMRMLALEYLTSSPAWPTCQQTADAPSNSFVTCTESVVSFGKPTKDDTFGWDNEYGQDNLTIAEFSATKYLVSNQEFLGFVEAGGYHQEQYWTDEGKQWLAFSQAKMPRFWLYKEHQYWQRNLLNEMPLPLDWPVEVNYLEAKAFCHWKTSELHHQGKTDYIRLPSEGEWLCLREQVKGDLVSWQVAPGNLNNEYFASSCPINTFKQNDFFDVVGNVWQWTDSTINGYTGFEVHPLYDDFSTPTFDGKHNLIKGGSWISSGNEAIKHSRYAFRRHFFQHAGFRYVTSAGVTCDKDIPNLSSEPFETDIDICQQLHCYYGQVESLSGLLKVNDGNDGLSDTELSYAKRVVTRICHYIDTYQDSALKDKKVLDLGCCVGAISFNLAPYVKQIDSVDSTARYIKHGVSLQAGNSVRYVMPHEGETVDFHEITLNSDVLKSAGKIQFSQGDTCNLKDLFTGYDVVIANSVLEKSYHPQLFLKNIQQRLNPNGLLIVLSDYHYTEQTTEKTKWLGGIKVNGENVTSFEGMSNILADKFSLLAQQQLTQMTKVNQRKIIVSFPELSVWQLKA